MTTIVVKWPYNNNSIQNQFLASAPQSSATDESQSQQSTMCPSSTQPLQTSLQTSNQPQAQLSETNNNLPSELSAEGCIGITDPRRGAFSDNFRWSYQYFGRCGDHPTEVHCNAPDTGYTESAQDQFRACLGKSAGYEIKCYRNHESYPQDLISRFNCCTGYTEQIYCDPRYCPAAKDNCVAVYAQYCSQPDKINDTKCLNLYTLNKDLYRDIVAPYCIAQNTDGSRFKEPACRRFCTENLNQCENKLKEVCKNKKPNDPTWSEICGCWYDDSVYTNFYNSLAEKWNVPDGFFVQPRVCGFPECKSANPAYRQPPPKEGCPPLNVTTCLANVKIDVSGSIVKDSPISVTVAPGCKSSYTPKPSSCSDTKPCPSTSDKCVQGKCVPIPRVCTVATEKTDCKADEKCIEGICSSVAPPIPSSFPIWAIILIVLGALVLLGAIAFVLLGKGGKKSTTATKTTNNINKPVNETSSTII